MQALWSLQTIGVWTQLPVDGSQASVVQASLSLQFFDAPATQTPPWHDASPVAQRLSLWQTVPFAFGGLEQTPVLGLQVPALRH